MGQVFSYKEGNLMKPLIIYRSFHHHNTEAIVKAIAPIINADIISADKPDEIDIAGRDCIGFASGIYMSNFDKTIYRIIERLGPKPGMKTFTVFTSGANLRRPPRRLTKILAENGYENLGNFSCKAFDTWGPLRFIGGTNRNRPNEADLEAAREFAAGLIPKING